MTQPQKHTETPWEALPTAHKGRPYETIVRAAEGFTARAIGATQEEADANAAHIVQCVNSRDALVEAVKELKRLGREMDKAAHAHLMMGEPMGPMIRAIQAFSDYSLQHADAALKLAGAL